MANPVKHTSSTMPVKNIGFAIQKGLRFKEFSVDLGSAVILSFACRLRKPFSQQPHRHT
tara:strand:- start:318 stop:494 length:177 start_codon:yes stop_codon:yes gene_type:complete